MWTLASLPAGSSRQLFIVSILVVQFLAVSSSTDAQVLRRLEGIDGGVRDVLRFHNLIFFATGSGVAYTYEDLSEARTIKAADGKNRTIYRLALVDGDIWVDADDGLFRVDQGKYRRVALDTAVLEGARGFFIEPDLQTRGDLWIGCSKGMFLKRSGRMRVEAVPLEDGSGAPPRIRYLKVLEDHDLLVVSEKAVLKGRPGSFAIVRNIPFTDIRNVVAHGNSYYIHARSGNGLGLYRLAEEVVAIRERGVDAIGGIGSELWASLYGEVYALHSGDVLRPRLRGLEKNVGFIGVKGGIELLVAKKRVWARKAGSIGVFNLIGENSERLAHGAWAFGLADSMKTDHSVWLWGDSGVYRVFEDIDLHVELLERDGFWGGNVSVKDVQYKSLSRSVDIGGLVSDYKVLMTKEHPGDARFEVEKYQPPGGQVLGFWEKEAVVWVALSDAHGTVRVLDREAKFGDNRWRQWTLGWLKTAGGKLAVSVLLLVFLPLLYTAADWYLVARSAPDYRRRLRSYARLEESNPFKVTWPLIRPRFAKRFKALREIAVGLAYEPNNQMSQEDAAKELAELYSAGIYETRSVSSDDLRALCYATKSCAPCGGIHLPLVVKLDRCGGHMSERDLAAHVLDSLHAFLPELSRDYLEDILVKGCFTFFFSVSSGSEEIVKVIKEFHCKRSDRYFTFVLKMKA